MAQNPSKTESNQVLSSAKGRGADTWFASSGAKSNSQLPAASRATPAPSTLPKAATSTASTGDSATVLQQTAAEASLALPISSAMRRGRFQRWNVEQQPIEEEGESWLLIYLDVMTLLLVMMVVLLAFTEPRPEEPITQAGILGIQGQTGPLQSDTVVGQQQPPLVVPEPPRIAEDPPGQEQPEPATDSIPDLGLDGLGQQIDVIVSEGTVSFRIANELLFLSGDATIAAAGLPVLESLVDVLNRIPYPVAIEGHTDNVPIQTERFPSNWELSTARAASIVRVLIAGGVDPERLRAVGYADTRPVSSNDSPQGRALNRRVDVILEFPQNSPTLGTSSAGGASTGQAPSQDATFPSAARSANTDTATSSVGAQ